MAYLVVHRERHTALEGEWKAYVSVLTDNTPEGWLAFMVDHIGDRMDWEILDVQEINLERAHQLIDKGVVSLDRGL